MSTATPSTPRPDLLTATVPLYARYYLAPDGVRHEWKQQAGSMKIPQYLQAIIQTAAFARAPWGRRRACYRGDNGRSAGIRTETNGWRRATRHYADYTAIMRADGRQLWVRYPNQSERKYPITPSGSVKINGYIVRRPTAIMVTTVRAHHLRRFYSAAIRPLSGITWIWDRQNRSGYYRSSDGEQYRTSPNPTKTARQYFREAVQAFQARRAETVRTAHRQAAKRRLEDQPERVFVTIDDSIAAGNCQAETEKFAKLILTELTGGYPAAIRADAILARRDDTYTHRACIQAALTH